MTATSVSDPLVGHVLDGRYQITERLARGGMATVYKAIDTRLTRTVAVKVMHVGLGDDADFARKFDREARAAARLSHPCVVSVFDQGRDEGRPFIVMEYVPGSTLRDLIVREAPLPPLRALELLEPVLSALAAAHEAGLVHRDVKPENVLISERSQIKVADFGLAKAVSAQTSTATQGLLIGTVSYLPPELVMSGKADARSDVYSAGIVLFELLTGRKPHTGETPIQVAYAHVHKDVPPPSTMRTAGPVPPYLDALIARATSRDPDHRPHDAKVLLAQVRRVRSALRDGLSHDPELTEDLSAVLAVSARVVGADEPTPREPLLGDPADFEPTEFVATGPLRASHAASPQGPQQRSSAPVSAPVPAPRPGPPAPPYRTSADRLSERRRTARRRGWLALVLVLLLTAGAAVTGWYVAEGRFTSAPTLQNLTQEEALATAEQARLVIRFDAVYSESVRSGQVVSTDPAAGARIRVGGEILAHLSKGPERYAMPAVAGLTQEAAQAAITGAHLVVGKVDQAYSEIIADGQVVRASYAKGQLLKPQTVVDLVVSEGRRPIPIVDYTGKDADEAIEALKKLGFKVVVEKKNSDEVAKDVVIEQVPNTAEGFKGDTVTITRSLGPVLVTVPNVRRMGVRAAQKVMADAGFKTRVRPVAVNYLGVGYVVTTDPKRLTRAPKGSTITLWVI